MKVLHISTSSTGGAYISVYRLVEAQIAKGIKAHVITLRDFSHQKAGVNFFFTSFIRKMNTTYSQFVAKNKYEFLSIFSSGAGILNYVIEMNPDIVHIHNWFNILSTKEISELGKKFPVVFTMHDSRIATGGCHIPYNCTNYKNFCSDCPAIKFHKSQVSKAKQRFLKTINSIDNYSIIAPSHWILSQAIQGGAASTALETAVIPNIAPTDLAWPKLRNNSEKVKLLFIAANLDSQTKGLSILLKAISKILSYNFQVELHVIGSGANKLINRYINGFRIKKYGSLDSEKISEVMRESDLLVVPSFSENFPNVILEAFSRGLVVVASSVGGIPEIITNGQNGYLYSGSDVDLADSIIKAIQNKAYWPKIRTAARNDLIFKYNNDRNVEVTLNLYNHLLESSRGNK